ncbi:TetR/AcrR family transcriptional regulator [Curvivirga sp.]|uniref:TetR/AcrR family transcriptional regulator n=1 Tax=Curvivirga sp. TaxID=2856848 RepID=UPI003B5BA529
MSLNKTALEILDIAENLTQTVGFNAFSYKDIQREVGVKTSSIHYYFPTKQDLATAIAKRYTDRFLSELDSINAKCKSGLEKLEGISKIFIDVSNANKLCLCGMLSSEILSLPEEGTAELRRFYAKTEAWISIAISQGIEEGDLKQVPSISDSAIAFLASLEGAILIARTRNNKDYIQVATNQAVNLLRK